MQENMQESCVSQNPDTTCTSITSQYADVSLPIKLNPFAKVNNLSTECCGEPVISLRPCQNSNCHCACEIVITQSVCIRIPVEYGTVADIGETVVTCKKNPNCGCAY